MGFKKYAAFSVIEARVAPRGRSKVSGRRGASGLFKQSHRADFSHIPVRPGFLYVRSRAISSRMNDNWDVFPAAEIKKAYKTFIGKPVFVNHDNADHRKARGVIVEAVLHEDVAPDGQEDTWVEVLMEVDALSYPKLAEAVIAGDIARTSMGTDVAKSKCTACGNVATNELSYCSHIPRMKGTKMYKTDAKTGKKIAVTVAEECYGLSFFENSLLVEDPADPTAFVLGVDDRGLSMTAKRRKAILDETRLPPRVDTLRDEACPVCGEAGGGYDGNRCLVCQFVSPPDFLQEPDTSVAGDFHDSQQVEDIVADEDFVLEADDSGDTPDDDGTTEVEVSTPDEPFRDSEDDEPFVEDDSDDSDDSDDDSESENPFAKSDDDEDEDDDERKQARRRSTRRAEGGSVMNNRRVTASRPLYEIAGDIRRDWTNPYFGAVPYLDAMESLDSITDNYFMDSGSSIVAYFLSNATGWRGETARNIKAELKAMLKKSGSARRATRKAAERVCPVCGLEQTALRYCIWGDDGHHTFESDFDIARRANRRVASDWQEVTVEHNFPSVHAESVAQAIMEDVANTPDGGKLNLFINGSMYAVYFDSHGARGDMGGSAPGRTGEFEAFAVDGNNRYRELLRKHVSPYSSKSDRSFRTVVEDVAGAIARNIARTASRSATRQSPRFTRTASHYETAKRILKNHQAETVDGILFDTQSANVYVKVYEALNDDNKARIEALPLERAVGSAWKLVSAKKSNRSATRNTAANTTQGGRMNNYNRVVRGTSRTALLNSIADDLRDVVPPGVSVSVEQTGGGVHNIILESGGEAIYVGEASGSVGWSNEDGSRYEDFDGLVVNNPDDHDEIVSRLGDVARKFFASRSASRRPVRGRSLRPTATLWTPRGGERVVVDGNMRGTVIGATNRPGHYAVKVATADGPKVMERQRWALRRLAEENPGVPTGWAVDSEEAGSEAPVETSDGARAPEGNDDPRNIGASPVTDTSADATDEPFDIGASPLTDVSAFDVVDVEETVDGSDPEDHPTRTETEVDYQNIADLDTSPAFPLEPFMALRLARLRIEAGIASGEDIVLSQRIIDSGMPAHVARHEIETLDRVLKSSKRVRRTAGRVAAEPVSLQESTAATAPRFSGTVAADEILW